jgi:hypothetical protein
MAPLLNDGLTWSQRSKARKRQKLDYNQYRYMYIDTKYNSNPPQQLLGWTLNSSKGGQRNISKLLALALWAKNYFCSFTRFRLF